ncbi:MAG: hypothetical protein DMG36_18575 [Acidobacteria bacterium]|nr:MAG: hypothetical protein DMG36_18575 [Acidobacteriota bacterium]
MVHRDLFSQLRRAVPLNRSKTSRNGRQHRRYLARRLEILRAAGREFRSRGFVETGMRDIAKAAELSPANLYNYFQGKHEILFGASREDKRIGKIAPGDCFAFALLARRGRRVRRASADKCFAATAATLSGREARPLRTGCAKPDCLGDAHRRICSRRCGARRARDARSPELERAVVPSRRTNDR